MNYLWDNLHDALTALLESGATETDVRLAVHEAIAEYSAEHIEDEDED